MGTDQIFNFIQIHEQIATSGQPSEEQFSAAKEEGYTAVINLAPYRYLAKMLIATTRLPAGQCAENSELSLPQPLASRQLRQTIWWFK